MIGLFALYVAGYSVGRIGEELLRVDPAHHILGLRLNFFVASLLFAIGVTWFIHTQRPRRVKRGTVRRGGALLAAAGALSLCGCRHSSKPSRSASTSSGPAPRTTSTHAAHTQLEPSVQDPSARHHS